MILVISPKNKLIFKGTELLQLSFLCVTGALRFRKEGILAQLFIPLPSDDELEIRWHWNHVCKAFGEQGWRKLRDIIRLHLFLQNLWNVFLLFNRSASEDLTVLSVVPCIFLWEDFQFIKIKKRKSLELQHNYSSICTNIDHHAHIPQA